MELQPGSIRRELGQPEDSSCNPEMSKPLSQREFYDLGRPRSVFKTFLKTNEPSSTELECEGGVPEEGEG